MECIKIMDVLFDLLNGIFTRSVLSKGHRGEKRLFGYLNCPTILYLTMLHDENMKLRDKTDRLIGAFSGFFLEQQS